MSWKEEEEEKKKFFYAQSTGRKVLDDCTNISEIGMNYSVATPRYDIHVLLHDIIPIDTKRGECGKKPSQKLYDVCISRIYAIVHGRNGTVKVMYIPAHTNHTLSIKDEAKHLPLPVSTRNEIAAKLQCGISVNRIMEG